MSSVWTKILLMVMKIVVPLFGLVTPEIKKLLNDFLTALYLKALATDNPWDDFAVGFLLDILAIPRPPLD
jgi:hypothetical protein